MQKATIIEALFSGKITPQNFFEEWQRTQGPNDNSSSAVQMLVWFVKRCRNKEEQFQRKLDDTMRALQQKFVQISALKRNESKLEDKVKQLRDGLLTKELQSKEKEMQSIEKEHQLWFQLDQTQLQLKIIRESFGVIRHGIPSPSNYQDFTRRQEMYHNSRDSDFSPSSQRNQRNGVSNRGSHNISNFERKIVRKELSLRSQRFPPARVSRLSQGPEYSPILWNLSQQSQRCR